MKNWFGWDKLICPYFTQTCRNVLSSYLNINGFTETATDEIGGLFFLRDGVFLEISYEIETAPNYAVSMVLGVGERKFDNDGHPRGIPYWYVISRDHSVESLANKRYASPAELEVLLLRYKNQFLEYTAKPLWREPRRIEVLVNVFRNEFNC